MDFEKLRAILLWPHIIGGGIALVTMWIPILTRKGGKAHRNAGKVYAASMLLAAVAALGISAGWILGGDPRQLDKGLFFGMLGLLAMNTTLHGLRVLKQKRRVEAHKHPLDLALSALTLLAGAALTLYGLVGGSILNIAFGGLSVFASSGQLRAMLRPPREKMFWWFEHMGSMGASCIATTTAFLVVNGRFMPDAIPELVWWLLPPIVGTTALIIAGRRERARFAARTPEP